MSFTTFLERENNILQSRLSANLFTDNLDNESNFPVPIVNTEQEIITPDQSLVSGTIYLIDGNSVNSTTNNLPSIPSNSTGIFIINNTNTNQNQIFTNTTYNVISSSTCCGWSYYNSTTNTIQTTSTNIITNELVLHGNNNYIRYGNITSNGYNLNIKNNKFNSVKKTVKNSIKRALKLLDNFGMEEDTKIFLNGKDIEISHPDSLFKFVITKRKYSNIISATEYPSRSTPFSLELFTKTGIHLANLCVYAEDTPMLDQLFMVAMYVKSGNEEDLLRTANFSSICRDIELKEKIIKDVNYLESKLIL